MQFIANGIYKNGNYLLVANVFMVTTTSEPVVCESLIL